MPRVVCRAVVLFVLRLSCCGKIASLPAATKCLTVRRLRSLKQNYRVYALLLPFSGAIADCSLIVVCCYVFHARPKHVYCTPLTQWALSVCVVWIISVLHFKFQSHGQIRGYVLALSSLVVIIILVHIICNQLTRHLLPVQLYIQET